MRDPAPRDLASQHCVPCRGGVPPLTGASLDALRRQLPPGWQVVDEHHLQKSFKCRTFREALSFVSRVGDLAEREGHHPEIHVAWIDVTLTIWTHKVKGLTESDFILAAKADALC